MKANPLKCFTMRLPADKPRTPRRCCSQSVPYLRSVDSPGEESYEGYAVEQRFSLEEAAELLLAAFPDCGVEADALPSQLELISLSETGRVKEMRVGNQTVQGRNYAPPWACAVRFLPGKPWGTR